MLKKQEKVHMRSAVLTLKLNEIQKQSETTPQMATATTYGTSPHYTYIVTQLIELPPTYR